MRVKELAELADTTVRTVRHYHHIGLLEVPPVRDGFRDYELAHLARLLRIRWLVSAGLSLPAVRELLDADPAGEGDEPLADLRTTLAAMDERIVELQAQRERIVSLIERAERYPTITPLPAALSLMYDRLATRMPTHRARLALEAERRIFSILAIRGYLPVGLEELVAALTPQDEDLVVDLFTVFADTAVDPAVIEEHVAALIGFTERHEDVLVAILRQLSSRQVAAFGLLGRLVRVAYPARAQRALIDRYLTELHDNPRLMAALSTGSNADE